MLAAGMLTPKHARSERDITESYEGGTNDSAAAILVRAVANSA